MHRGYELAIIGLILLPLSCWDTPEHCYEESMSTPSPDGGIDSGMGDTDTETETDTGTEGTGQGDLPPGWENFGGPCETDEDCKGYSDRSRCLAKNILGIINVPGGYCTACCDVAEEYCAENIQCIGLDEVYLICASQCDADEDCRQEEGYICTTLPYIEIPGTFCMPDKDHMEPDPYDEPSDPHCDWPWLEDTDD